MILNQIDGFFPRLDHIMPEIKKINLYNHKDYSDKFVCDSNWPGLRSGNFAETKPIFWNYITNLLFQNNLINNGLYNISAQLHLRLNEDNEKDWIHKDDEYIYSILIYLSDTNLESGTYLYDENENIINDIKFVKNRLIMFSSQYKHKGYGYYGTNIDDGRLTLNIFVKNGT